MNYDLKVNSIKTISEIAAYWTDDDYRSLLEAFEFSDSKDLDPSELREVLEMAISDFDPSDAAEIILQHKLHEKLNKGQIQNLSHEMVEGNESEEYPDIALHYPLFNINQLLNKAYNGVFPSAKATKIDFELKLNRSPAVKISEEIVLQAMSKVLRKQNLIVRLYEEEILGKKPFKDAEFVIWMLDKSENDNYEMITSDYWINKEDFTENEVSSSINLYED